MLLLEHCCPVISKSTHLHCCIVVDKTSSMEWRHTCHGFTLVSLYIYDKYISHFCSQWPQLSILLCQLLLIWVISPNNFNVVDALDQWCLRMLLGIKWYQFVLNDDVRRLTKQPKLTAIIQSRRLTYLGILCAWRTMQMPRGSCWPSLQQTGEDNQVIPHHVAQHCPTGSETTPAYAPRSSTFGSEPPSVEDDVDLWRYAILELHARNDDDDGVPFLVGTVQTDKLTDGRTGVMWPPWVRAT